MDESEPYLVGVLRGVIRMIRHRGFVLKPQDSHLHELNKKVQPDYIQKNFFKNGDVFRQRNGNNPITQYIAKNKLDENGERRMMSDYFENPITSERCIVFFSSHPREDAKISNAEMVYFIDMMNTFKDSVRSGIIITPNLLSSEAEKNFKSMKSKYSLTHFLDSEIMFNPLSHVYSPDMKIFNMSEQKKFMETNELDVKKLPVVYSDEPTIKYLGGTSGQIVEYTIENFIPGLLISIETFHRIIKDPVIKKS